MLKTSKICEIHVFIVYAQDHSNRTLRRVGGGAQSRYQETSSLYRAGAE